MSSAFTPVHRGGSGPPLVCLHGFTDTWRTWDLVLPALEHHHEVLAPTLAGHAGGPPLDGPLQDGTLAEAVEAAMDDAGFATAHIVGNSLGGYLALQLAGRGRARSVVALSPAGGWAPGDDSFRETLEYFRTMRGLVKAAAPYAENILAAPDGRRNVTRFVTVNYRHIPVELLAHQMRGAAACDVAEAMIDFALTVGWPLDPEPITCPVRFIWGTEDALLHWPSAAALFREQLPQADWVVLDGVGHCPQLDVPAETADLIVGFTGGR